MARFGSKAKLQLYKKKIKQVAIVVRPGTPQAVLLGEELSEWLQKRKIQSFSHPEQKLGSIPKLKSPSTLDLVVVLGGDGTYLEALRMLGDARVPLMGVNMGSLGFLTVTRVADLIPMMELALAGKLELKHRSMIRIQLRNGRKVRDEFTALNEMVIERGPQSRLINLAITIDRLPIATLKADGLIVATPTGSTAYNLAAAGPILHPEVNALVVTAICPHSLTLRPFIFPDDRDMQFALVGSQDRAALTVDGVKKANIGPEDEVWVQRSAHDHLFLRKPGHNYFSLLREKLKFGERA